MIEWIRDKFASTITFFFVVAIIICTICGGILGYTIGETLGCLIGLAIGLFLGIISGILSFGFFATIIHISESCDDMASKLDRLYSSQNYLAQNISAAVSNDKSASENTSSSGDDEDDLVLNDKSSSENTGLSNIWVCTKCGESNPVGTMLCRKCGK